MICGLGNLEKTYENTRHNIGFTVVDKIAEEFAVEFNKSKLHAVIAEFVLEGEKVYLMKPATLMNRSGTAVRSFIDFYKLEDLQSILIICDDLNLELGRLRIRKKGGHGSHNGLRDIIQKLGTNEFPRLRIGTGIVKESKYWHDFVLSPFKASEKPIIRDAIELAAEASVKWSRNGVEEAQKFLAK